MPLSIELRLDVRADDAIRRLWDGLADARIHSVLRDGGQTPHITLAVCHALSRPDDAVKELMALAEKEPPLALTLAHLGVFPGDEGVVFAGVAPTEALLGLHARLHRWLEARGDEAWDYYRPGRWVPHVTLAIRANAGERGAILRWLHARPEWPLPLKISAISLVSTPGEVLLAQAPLVGAR